MKKWILKSAASFTLFCFTFTQIGFAALDLQIVERQEVPVSPALHIPAEIASVETLFQEPQSDRLILQIQNAHANYDAQIKIHELLKYLNKTYGIETVFVEGAAEKLNPDYLKIFPDQTRNQKLIDWFVKEGILDGAGLFIQDQIPGVEGLPIEDIKLYRKNYDALKKVFEARSEIDRALAKIEAQISKETSKKLSSELKRTLSEWQRFEKGQREFFPYMNALAKKAHQVLALDLQNVFSQAAWPQITHLLALQETEKKLDLKKAEEEKVRLIEFLKSKKISQTLIESLESSLVTREPANPLTRIQSAVSYRQLIETLIKEARPQGFRLKDWPAFTTFAAYQIQKQELDAQKLHKEIETLFAQIIDKLAKTPEQKKLVLLYQDFGLFTKLLHLELSREEFKTWQSAKRTLPAGRQVAHGVTANFFSQIKSRSALSALRYAYSSALEFYELALKRDQMFYEKLDQQMKAKGITKAAIVTGGFHTEGLSDLFRANKTSFAVLTPHISEITGDKLYRDVMLGSRALQLQTSFIPQAAYQQSSPVLGKMGFVQFVDVRSRLNSQFAYKKSEVRAVKSSTTVRTSRPVDAERLYRSEVRATKAVKLDNGNQSAFQLLDLWIKQNRGKFPKHFNRNSYQKERHVVSFKFEPKHDGDKWKTVDVHNGFRLGTIGRREDPEQRSGQVNEHEIIIAGDLSLNLTSLFFAIAEIAAEDQIWGTGLFQAYFFALRSHLIGRLWQIDNFRKDNVSARSESRERLRRRHFGWAISSEPDTGPSEFFPLLRSHPAKIILGIGAVLIISLIVYAIRSSKNSPTQEFIDSFQASRSQDSLKVEMYTKLRSEIRLKSILNSQTSRFRFMRQAGFTLTELLIYIAIWAVVTGIGGGIGGTIAERMKFSSWLGSIAGFLISGGITFFIQWHWVPGFKRLYSSGKDKNSRSEIRSRLKRFFSRKPKPSQRLSAAAAHHELWRSSAAIYGYPPAFLAAGLPKIYQPAARSEVRNRIPSSVDRIPLMRNGIRTTENEFNRSEVRSASDDGELFFPESLRQEWGGKLDRAHLAAAVVSTDEDGNLTEKHEANLRAYAAQMVKRGIKGVAINVHTGRGHLLSTEVKEKVYRIWRSAFNEAGMRNAMIVTGVSSYEEAKAAKEMGIDGALVLPFQLRKDIDKIQAKDNPAKQRALRKKAIIEYHQNIAKADLPLIFFNLNSELGGVRYNKDEMREVLSIPQIIAAKSASLSSLELMQDLLDLVAAEFPDLPLVNGEDRDFAQMLRTVALKNANLKSSGKRIKVGGLLGMSSFAPELSVRALEIFDSENPEQTKEFDRELWYLLVLQGMSTFVREDGDYAKTYEPYPALTKLQVLQEVKLPYPEDFLIDVATHELGIQPPTAEQQERAIEVGKLIAAYLKAKTSETLSSRQVFQEELKKLQQSLDEKQKQVSFWKSELEKAAGNSENPISRVLAHSFLALAHPTEKSHDFFRTTLESVPSGSEETRADFISQASHYVLGLLKEPEPAEDTVAAVVSDPKPTLFENSPPETVLPEPEEVPMDPLQDLEAALLAYVSAAIPAEKTLIGSLLKAGKEYLTTRDLKVFQTARERLTSVAASSSEPFDSLPRILALGFLHYHHATLRSEVRLAKSILTSGYTLGYDASTQAFKTHLIGLNGIVWSHEEKYDQAEYAEFDAPKGFIQSINAASTDKKRFVTSPRMIARALRRTMIALSEAGFKLSDIKGIAAGHMQHGFVAFSEGAKKPFDPSIPIEDQLEDRLALPFGTMWMDKATTAQGAAITANPNFGSPEAMRKITGSEFQERFWLGQMRYLYENHRAEYDKTIRFVSLGGFIAYLLTGNWDLPTDPGEVVSSHTVNVAKPTEYLPFLDQIVPELTSKLPPIKSNQTQIGKLAPHWKQYGFSTRTRIANGTGDNPANVISFRLKPGTTGISFGSSGVISDVIKNKEVLIKALENKYGNMMGTALRKVIEILCFNNSGLALESVRNQFISVEEARQRLINHEDGNKRYTDEELKVLEVTKKNHYDKLINNARWAISESLISSVDPGSHGAIFFPMTTDEGVIRIKHNPDQPLAFNAEGQPLSFDPSNRAVVLRAAFEGMVLAMKAVADLAELDVTNINLTGGTANSPTFRQIVADVFNAKVNVLKKQTGIAVDGPALGMAILARQVVYNQTHKKPISLDRAAQGVVDFEAPISPNAENGGVYQGLLSRFSQMLLDAAGVSAKSEVREKETVNKVMKKSDASVKMLGFEVWLTDLNVPVTASEKTVTLEYKDSENASQKKILVDQWTLLEFANEKHQAFWVKAHYLGEGKVEILATNQMPAGAENNAAFPGLVSAEDAQYFEYLKTLNPRALALSETYVQLLIEGTFDLDLKTFLQGLLNDDPEVLSSKLSQLVNTRQGLYFIQTMLPIARKNQLPTRVRSELRKDEPKTIQLNSSVEILLGVNLKLTAVTPKNELVKDRQNPTVGFVIESGLQGTVSRMGRDEGFPTASSVGGLLQNLQNGSTVVIELSQGGRVYLQINEINITENSVTIFLRSELRSSNPVLNIGKDKVNELRFLANVLDMSPETVSRWYDSSSVRQHLRFWRAEFARHDISSWESVMTDITTDIKNLQTFLVKYYKPAGVGNSVIHQRIAELDYENPVEFIQFGNGESFYPQITRGTQARDRSVRYKMNIFVPLDFSRAFVWSSDFRLYVEVEINGEWEAIPLSQDELTVVNDYGNGSYRVQVTLPAYTTAYKLAIVTPNNRVPHHYSDVIKVVRSELRAPSALEKQLIARDFAGASKTAKTLLNAGATAKALLSTNANATVANFLIESLALPEVIRGISPQNLETLLQAAESNADLIIRAKARAIRRRDPDLMVAPFILPTQVLEKLEGEAARQGVEIIDDVSGLQGNPVDMSGKPNRATMFEYHPKTLQTLIVREGEVFYPFASKTGGQIYLVKVKAGQAIRIQPGVYHAGFPGTPVAKIEVFNGQPGNPNVQVADGVHENIFTVTGAMVSVPRSEVRGSASSAFSEKSLAEELFRTAGRLSELTFRNGELAPKNEVVAAADTFEPGTSFAEIEAAVQEFMNALESGDPILNAARNLETLAANSQDPLLSLFTSSDVASGLVITRRKILSQEELRAFIFFMALNTGMRTSILMEGISRTALKELARDFRDAKDLNGNLIFDRLTLSPVKKGHLSQAANSHVSGLSRFTESTQDVLVMVDGDLELITGASVLRSRLGEGSSGLHLAKNFVGLLASRHRAAIGRNWETLNRQWGDQVLQRTGIAQIEIQANGLKRSVAIFDRIFAAKATNVSA